MVFPDIAGVGAMGHTVDDALANAEDVIRDYALEMKKDCAELATPSPIESIIVPDDSQLVTVTLNAATIPSPRG